MSEGDLYPFAVSLIMLTVANIFAAILTCQMYHRLDQLIPAQDLHQNHYFLCLLPASP
jgi:hypothetical protein